MFLNENVVRDIALKESSHFNVVNYKDGFVITLSENFKRSFPSEVSTYNHFIVCELKKNISENISIYKTKDYVVIKNNKKALHEQAAMPIIQMSTNQNFWEENDISDIVNEIVDPNSIDVEDFKKKDELCPKVWDNETMTLHNDVRKGLLRIAKEFIEYADLSQYKFDDITLTGSLANYNYSDESDIDLHILMDTSQIGEDKELVSDYLKNKKTLWNDNMPIDVKGHEVELYVQDSNEPHTSTGVYSIMKNKWLTKPIKEIIQLDTNNIQKKATEYMQKIDDVMDSENVNEITRLFDKIKSMRKAGLQAEGEFSVENIVFKILRRNGYIEKLVDKKKDLITQELTIETHGK